MRAMTVVTEREQDEELPERWSAKAKTEVVLRRLKQAQAKVAELAMRFELAEMLLEKRG
jgi:hypothetical protein